MDEQGTSQFNSIFDLKEALEDSVKTASQSWLRPSEKTGASERISPSNSLAKINTYLRIEKRLLGDPAKVIA